VLPSLADEINWSQFKLDHNLQKQQTMINACAERLNDREILTAAAPKSLFPMKNQAQYDASALAWDRTLQDHEHDYQHDSLPSMGKGYGLAKKEDHREHFYLPQEWAFHR
jgi:hypothetical protein